MNDSLRNKNVPPQERLKLSLTYILFFASLLAWIVLKSAEINSESVAINFQQRSELPPKIPSGSVFPENNLARLVLKQTFPTNHSIHMVPIIKKGQLCSRSILSEQIITLRELVHKFVLEAFKSTQSKLLLSQKIISKYYKILAEKLVTFFQHL
jgi:hypothetical protein